MSQNQHNPARKVIILTGASKGLGLAILRILLSFSSTTASSTSPGKPGKVVGAGYKESYEVKVVAVSRSESQGLKELKKERSDDIEVILGDVSSEETSARACQVALENWGQIDGLILNAGTLDPLGQILSTSVSDWKNCFDVNFFSLIYLLQHATPHLRESAHSAKGHSESAHGPNVVFVSSGAATGNTGAWGAYNATKAAMNSLCRTYANEEKSISSFAIRPGVVDMQGQLRSLGPATMNPKEMERFMTAHKEGKLLRPEAPGHVIAALALSGPKAKSGQFISWDAQELLPYREDAAALLKKARSSKGPSGPVKAYLILYNLASLAGWAVILSKTISLSIDRQPLSSISDLARAYDYRNVGDWTTWVQTGALLEVLHAAFGFVRSSPVTVLMQVASRIWAVWGVLHGRPQSRENPLVATMFFAWSFTECIRYAFYACNLLGVKTPKFLLWLRYNTFYVLYPLGAGSEAFLMFSTLPLIKNIGTHLWQKADYFVLTLFFIWWPALYVLYNHMISLRRKTFARPEDAKRPSNRERV